MALEFPNEGHYVVRIGGAGAQHVRLKSIKNEDETYEVDVDRHLFTTYQDFSSFMEGAVIPPVRYLFHVHKSSV